MTPPRATPRRSSRPSLVRSTTRCRASSSICRGGSRPALQRSIQEPAERQPVHDAERELARAVVSARQYGELVIDPVAAERVHQFAREIDREGQIVQGVYEQNAPAAHALEKRQRTDGQPHQPERGERQVAVW